MKQIDLFPLLKGVGEDVRVNDLAHIARPELVELGSHIRSEEHTSELQSPDHIVCSLLLEKKKKIKKKKKKKNKKKI